MKRRVFIQLAAISAAVIALPARVFAAWDKDAFELKDQDKSIEHLYGSGTTESSVIGLNVPEIAENGAAVNVSVDATQITGVESIAIYVHENPRPLVAYFDLASNVVPDVSTRVKMGKSSDVTAVVKADGKVYSTTKAVKVTIGGCGG